LAGADAPVNAAARAGMKADHFSEGPLQGVRVIDLTSVVLGPYATRILADMGADVIKIETVQGDQTRHYRPMRHEAMAGYYMNLNRNKRSVVLDLKRAEGMSALKALLKGAQVFVHNMRQGAADRLGLGYEDVRTVNPDIVYCAAVGFGSTGPYADKAAYDDVIQAGSGLASLQARVHGEPAYAPTVLCDKITGQTVAYAVLAALYQQARGGGGQAVEVPMLETAVEFALVEHLHAATFEPPLGEHGFNRVLSRYRKPFRTADGFMCILPYSDRNWQHFFRFTGRSDFAEDPRFTRLADRAQNIDQLYALVEQEAVHHTNAQWLAFCDEVSIPCMPVHALEDLAEDPHLRAVGMFEAHQHPSEGAYRTVRSPVSFGASRFQVRHHAPRLGADTREVLREAGLRDGEIDALVQSGSAVEAGP
jgi:crotonobetainyl-CoA:carnitine CoA-transferase CaiB-like acyl-CoA transferase